MNYRRFFKTATLKRITSVDDGWGPVESISTIGPITGRMRMLGGSEQYSVGADETITTHRFYTEDGILNGDVIEYDGIDHRVLYVNNVMTFERLIQVDCEVIDV